MNIKQRNIKIEPRIKLNYNTHKKIILDILPPVWLYKKNMSGFLMKSYCSRSVLFLTYNHEAQM